MNRKLTIAIAGAVLMSVAGMGSMAGAQAVDAIKESAKATAEGTKEGVDNAKAAVHSGSEKAVDEGKAKVHKAKSHYHRHKAKKAADAAVH